ncbi:uroporphyrinogen-III synthase [uncultured Paracoccus sp.]|uniref:uroporphyrinogen-III synthase n=1 Tax=uncultured Paracoccus sp. TaxID=189685 RepID=UPI00262E728E|nr:uroporphyrinogen-III synthase [uncultured Paracoccus sp.]
MPSADPRPTVLLTRPEADSRRFAGGLPPGLPVVISPILRIVPVAHDAARLASAPGLVFTSAHAVATAGPGQGRLALCVGPRTAALARAAGFQVQEGATGEAGGLLPLIAASPVPLIHPQGRHLARELPVEGMVVYDQWSQPLSDAAQGLLADAAPVILPLFSPRSARLLSDAVENSVKAPILLAAISESARAGWGHPAERSRIAARPDADGVIKAIRSLLSPEQ